MKPETIAAVASDYADPATGGKMVPIQPSSIIERGVDRSHLSGDGYSRIGNATRRKSDDLPDDLPRGLGQSFIQREDRPWSSTPG